MPRHRSPFVPTGAPGEPACAQAQPGGRAERPYTRPAATQRLPGNQAKPYQILPNLPLVDSCFGGAPSGALVGVKRLCPRPLPGPGGQQRGKGKAERAARPAATQRPQARAPKATAAPRRAATGQARARPAEGGPDRPAPGRTGGAQRPRGGPAGRGGRSPSSERGRAGTTKPSHPSGGGRRPAHPGPFSGAFVHFRPVSRFSDLSARGRLLILWLLLSAALSIS